MADIVYTVNQDSPEAIAGFEQYSQEDKALVSSFQINNLFDPAKHYSELHILSLADDLLESTYTYSSYTLLGNAQSAGQAGASVLTIDPIADSKAYGYENGGVKLLYHFLDDLYSADTNKVEFYIQDISPDRTEISLSTLNLTPEVVATITATIKANLQSQSYFTGFRLNFKNNDLFIATNIDTLGTDAEQVVVVKLYEPLPTTYNIKSTLNIVDVVSDSVAYEVDAEFIVPPTVAPTLRSPNFDIEVADQSVIPTQYYSYDDLFSYPVTNANSQIFSTVSEKGIDISVDYSDFSNFVHFSSAQERLLNFKYKLDLVFSYSASIASASAATTGLQGISGSVSYYQNLITGVVNNFDHYERFLYYESGSSSWPKSNTTKPYINKPSSDSESITWYSNQIDNSLQYDLTNYNSLVYSIPTYLRDDANNENYLTFVYMVGQHFDNLWLYSKAVTDKYDGDNRMDYGISKDLVAEALTNFGVKLYTSNKSVEDLFTTFIGQAYQSGSEVINYYITGSLTGSNTPIQPTPYDNYQKEVQKRIYHNLPLLLKSKGTERGLRALINCLGIPGDILDIKLYGGRNVNERPFYGDYQYYTSSLDKVRLDNTGSLVSGSTVSNYVSIVKRDNKYTDDLHAIEVGFSPTDNINQYIISQSSPTFNIDEYLGDPSNLTSGSYSGLQTVADSILGTIEQYNLQDYVRLIKFFDNTVFKMVKDFVPARAVADTGVIIKPNLLNRSKAKSVSVSGIRPEYTASIDIAFITGSDGGAFTTSTGTSDVSWIEILQTPQGLANSYVNQGTDQPLYTGELGGTELIVSDGELNDANPFKYIEYDDTIRNVIAIKDFPRNICAIELNYPSVTLTTPQTINLRSAFNIPGDIYVTYYQVFSFGRFQIDNPNAFSMTENYTEYIIEAQKSSRCVGQKLYTTSFCSIALTAAGSISIVQLDTTYNITTWFQSPYNTSLEYKLYYNNGSSVAFIEDPVNYQFVGGRRSLLGTYVYIEVSDPTVVGGCTQRSGDILVQAQVTLEMDPPGSVYLFTSGGQGPTTSTLANRFFPDSPGDRDYRYYGQQFTGQLFTTRSNSLPTASGNYNVFVTVPADTFYQAITSPILPFTINKNVLTIKANDRAVAESTDTSQVTAPTNNSFTVTGLQGGDTNAVIAGTVTYTTNYTNTTPSGQRDVFIRPVVTGLSAVNYTFVGVDGLVTVGNTAYNSSDYSADDYITGSV